MIPQKGGVMLMFLIGTGMIVSASVSMFVIALLVVIAAWAADTYDIINPWKRQSDWRNFST